MYNAGCTEPRLEGAAAEWVCAGCLVKRWHRTATGRSVGWGWSKQELECELKLAGVLRAGDAAEIRGEGGAVGDVEIRVIEKVVGFGAELQLGGFGEADVFLQREVEFEQARSDDGVAGGGAEAIERGQREERGSEPLLRVLGSVVGIPYKVGALGGAGADIRLVAGDIHREGRAGLSGEIAAGLPVA